MSWSLGGSRNPRHRHLITPHRFMKLRQVIPCFTGLRPERPVCDLALGVADLVVEEPGPLTSRAPKALVKAVTDYEGLGACAACGCPEHACPPNGPGLSVVPATVASRSRLPAGHPQPGSKVAGTPLTSSPFLTPSLAPGGTSAPRCAQPWGCLDHHTGRHARLPGSARGMTRRTRWQRWRTG